MEVSLGGMLEETLDGVPRVMLKFLAQLMPPRKNPGKNTGSNSGEILEEILVAF